MGLLGPNIPPVVVVGVVVGLVVKQIPGELLNNAYVEELVVVDAVAVVWLGGIDIVVIMAVVGDRNTRLEHPIFSLESFVHPLVLEEVFLENQN